MKKLRITVENRAYEVTVQVLEDDDATAMRTSLPPPKLSTHPPAFQSTPAANANVAALISKPRVPTPAPSNGADLESILAPVAGTVVKLFVQAGVMMEAKAPVVMLDAMKMDTYIYAPRNGVVAAVEVNVGDSVQVGDCLIRYGREA